MSYELLILIAGSKEPNAAAIDASVQELIKKTGATITLSQKKDKRKLTFPINHEQYGVYFNYRITGLEKADILKANLQLHEDVMRFLLLRVDKHMESHWSAQATTKAESEKIDAKQLDANIEKIMHEKVA